VLTKPWITLLAALFLVLVPTLFSVFTEWTKWDALPRVIVVVAWFVAAALAALSTARQGRQVDELVGEPLTQREKERVVAAARLTRALLSPEQTGFPSHYEFRLFLMDPAVGRLLPAFESEGIDQAPEGWAPNQGATGLAWQANTRVLVKGRAVSDESYGLSATQQERYRDLAIVAAMPIRTARGRVIGVLSVSSTEDDGFLELPEAILEHLELAEVAARILVDILGMRE
jgi:DNA-binding IclR family transcriptional regulator